MNHHTLCFGEYYLLNVTDKIASNVHESFLGSIVGVPSEFQASHSAQETPNVLEIITTVMVTKASKTFLDSFKNDGDASNNVKKLEEFSTEGLESSVVDRVEMEIHSQKLIDALRAIIDYYPGSKLFAPDKVLLPQPFAPLLQYRDEIEAYKNQHPPWHDEDYRTETNRHIDILLDYLDPRYREKLNAERERYKQSPPVCTYDMLWLLYKPGEVCYRYPTPGQLQAGIAKNFFDEIDKPPAHLFGWSISFGGKTFGREPFHVDIAPFVGEREISTLECFPARFLPLTEGSFLTQEDVRKYLIDRGRKCWNVSRPTYCDYNGTTANFPFRHIKGRVMVDSLSCFGIHKPGKYDEPGELSRPILLEIDNHRLHRFPDYQDAKEEVIDGLLLDDFTKAQFGCGCSNCTGKTGSRQKGRFFGYKQCDPFKSHPPNEEEYFLLCSYRTYAFDLTARTWEMINVDGLDTDIKATNNFKHLVLPDEVHDTVWALAKAFENQSPSQPLATDIIRGKGLGTIFLLHGPPGTYNYKPRTNAYVGRRWQNCYSRISS
jgi:hypothetical protein